MASEDEPSRLIAIALLAILAAVVPLLAVLVARFANATAIRLPRTGAVRKHVGMRRLARTSLASAGEALRRARQKPPFVPRPLPRLVPARTAAADHLVSGLFQALPLRSRWRGDETTAAISLMFKPRAVGNANIVGGRAPFPKEEAGKDAEAVALKQRVVDSRATDALKAMPSLAPSSKARLAAADDEPLLKRKLAATTAVRPPKLAPKPATTEERPPARRSPLRALPMGGETPREPRAARAPLRAPTCEIQWWRGYFSSQFVAVVDGGDGTATTIASSRYFRWRKSSPPPERPEATLALRALVESLEREGWTVSGRGNEWFSFRMCAPEPLDDANQGDEPS